jgi:predicted nucleic-acid-binding protein
VIGVDTNVVLRMFVEDNPGQARVARALAAAGDRLSDPILVTPLVLAEIEWSLRSNFHLSKPDILDVFDQILGNLAFLVDQRDAAEAAIEEWRVGKADFADYLIGASARELGARTTMTFDRKPAETAAFTLLTA